MDLKFLTYSTIINNVDYTDTLKKKSDFNYINLDKLANDFPLDFEYEPPDYIPYGTHPGFISKNYYKSSPELGYNYPPKGPIPDSFVCIYCKKTGPEYHSITCKRPFESSLVLTDRGTSKYPGISKGTAYLLIAKKTGQKKVITDSIRSEKFTNAVELIYESENFSQTIVRIFRNGVINIGSATDPDFPRKVVDKINKCDALTAENPDRRYVIHPELSYKYLILAQFNVCNSQSRLDLRSFDNFLREYKKVYGGKNVLMSESGSYPIEKYVFNSGEIESRNSKPTNPYIKFDMILETTKVNVMVYNKGAVQLRASNIKGHKGDIDNGSIKEIYSFLREIFEAVIRDSTEAGYPVVIPDTVKIKKIGIDNTIDSKEPQKCQNRAGYEVRPVPYSFYGKCPLPGYYVPPRGVRRNDGKYEPCCFKINKTGKDSRERLYDILINGYPDKDSIKYAESIPDPDNLTSVYKPGTKILESRRRVGLKDLSSDHLIQCIQDSGYIEEKNVFNSKKNQEYIDLKKSVLDEYSLLTGTRAVLKQSPLILTEETFGNFTSKMFMVAPIPSGTINALLYFNSRGESYFLNINQDISESGLPSIPQLGDTIIEGFLSPYKEPDFIFYITDLLFYNKINVMGSPFYNQTNKDRFTGLTHCLGVINRSNTGGLQVELNYDLDLVNGSKYYLTNLDVSGLLFVGYSSKWSSSTNKNLMMWTNVDVNYLFIGLDVEKDPTKKNRWFVSLDGRKIPQDLLPQIDSSVEVPIKFTDDNKIKNGDHILFKVLLNQVTGKIGIKKPLAPVEKLDVKVNDYSDVINLLRSIQTPIQKESFLFEGGFKVGSKVYTSVSIDRPLTAQ
jgi:hypothetical protein